MSDAFLMRHVECSSHLPRIVNDGFHRQRALGRLALDQLHHQLVWTDIVQRADIGMIQRGHDPRFAIESFGKPFGADLYGDFAVQPGVACPIHFTHSAFADQAVYSEAPTVRREPKTSRESKRNTKIWPTPYSSRPKITMRWITACSDIGLIQES